MAAALKEADESFVRRSTERLDMGAEKYGALKFLSVDTLEEAMVEVLDLANYARMTYIKLYFLQSAIAEAVQQHPAADKEGFVSLKEMFTGQGGEQ